ncbi:hypothetical protein B0H17DRAFT_1199242 [Mycena rosella]|uniref:Uncharacterized protein n=1 Tax=Mycena rosella TaxID=1033263 RepID=A0AAD7DPD5_MYCRO|nr:hypothetical protein B0H17DRAFT_1199242 [Mycena rosella]
MSSNNVSTSFRSGCVCSICRRASIASAEDVKILTIAIPDASDDLPWARSNSRRVVLTEAQEANPPRLNAGQERPPPLLVVKNDRPGVLQYQSPVISIRNDTIVN